MSGKIAAHMTAKIVIASAKRLIDMRHCCLKSSRIAEISVPAWPMPIHQTKLMMSNAQPTGMLLPQMPMPLSSSQPSAMFRPIEQREADQEAEHPAERRALRQRNLRDRFGDGLEVVPGRDDRMSRTPRPTRCT